MILATIKKEMLLMSRDIHALAVLFLMPLAFIMIMSLAMQNTYSNEQTLDIKGLFLSEQNNTFAQTLQRYLLKTSYLHWVDAEKHSEKSAKEAIRNREIDFALVVSQTTSTNDDKEKQHIALFLSPSITPQSLLLIQSATKEALGKNRLHNFLQELNASSDEEVEANIAAISSKDVIHTEYLYFDKKAASRPSSVQQSVPAWLVFAMFFVLIPMSSAMISEVQLGTLRRLRSMHISSTRFLIGKIVPFLIINQIQLIIMLAAGVYIMPLLGGDKLIINGNASGLLLMSLTTSFAAVGFALLISVMAKTQEQATALGGTFNIILAAIGGIMVPKFIMPESMQTFANISPMSWALDGFLEIILHGSDTLKIVPYATTLSIFAIITLFLATYIFNRRINYNE